MITARMTNTEGCGLRLQMMVALRMDIEVRQVKLTQMLPLWDVCPAKDCLC